MENLILCNYLSLLLCCPSQHRTYFSSKCDSIIVLKRKAVTTFGKSLLVGYIHFGEMTNRSGRNHLQEKYQLSNTRFLE